MVTITEEQVHRLLCDGDAPQHFAQLGFGVLVTRMKGAYRNEPTPQTLERCTEEINAYVQKFESLMQADLAKLFKL